MRLSLHQPANDTALEVNHRSNDQDTQRHPLPPQKISPGHFLEYMEEDSAYNRTPERTFSSQQGADHHKDTKIDRLIGRFQRFKVN